ncbi:GbsR/MarR family transcriptional regulator [Allonocardiopsis opalescens]|uniref:GbsR/MarR family transcriptional regulator n=1 Tax=Allonocardiopsis opalescens TaxID=1144618 RepID=UPI001B80E638|nr:MarR family transcriptional regulator [Allonocardiopsis opalescens]
MTGTDTEPDGRHGGADDEAGRVIERFALLLSESGWPRMPARVFVAILIAPDGRRTAAELAETLRISPAAVSGAVRYLSQVGLVAREREPGRRRDHYRLYDDLWYESITRRDTMIQRWVQYLGEGVQVVGPDTPAGARLEETRQFFAFMHDEIPRIIDRWRAYRAAHVDGGPPAEEG